MPNNLIATIRRFRQSWPRTFDYSHEKNRRLLLGKTTRSPVDSRIVASDRAQLLGWGLGFTDNQEHAIGIGGRTEKTDIPKPRNVLITQSNSSFTAAA